MRNQKRLAELKRIQPLPLPEGLEMAFQEIKLLNTGHPYGRGTDYGRILHTETCGNRAKLPRDGRYTEEGGIASACGLDAARKAWRCYRDEVPCEILSLRLGPWHPGAGVTHFVAVYWTPDGTPFVWDADQGSRALYQLAKHCTDAALIAETWCLGSTRAVWLTGPMAA